MSGNLVMAFLRNPQKDPREGIFLCRVRCHIKWKASRKGIKNGLTLFLNCDKIYN